MWPRLLEPEIKTKTQGDLASFYSRRNYLLQLSFLLTYFLTWFMGYLVWWSAPSLTKNEYYYRANLFIYCLPFSIPSTSTPRDKFNVIFFLFIILTFLPFIMISRRSKFLYLINILSGLFISLFILISWCGACLVQEPFISMTRYLVYPGLSLSKLNYHSVQLRIL